MGRVNPELKLDRKNLESLLEKVLVPVEPNPQFIRHLRAKLVRVQGNRTFHPWLVITVGVTAVLLLATWMSVAMRILLGFLSLLGILQRSSNGNDTRQSIPS